MKKKLMILSFAALLVLSACGQQSATTDHNSHQSMNHSGTGEVPEGLKVEANPTYKVGEEVVIHAEHMPGMDGAKATVVGAYDTTVYSVSYTPTTGGEKVTNHKWVIHEEIKDAGSEPFQAGDTVTLDAEHMEGMKGAEATIDTAEKMTVYMVDYTPTTGGEVVKNHQWVVESELGKN
ncbi:hypothetical protein FHS18_003868 [Paenibacillus phyllosphaerae]|uniref:DUF1541 domain-containing protein n=1 Tax=Paenibacillus phyllosphaerae TaxID=274593 RepID=A0A7W5AZU5_9BACL|nr:YdhK family protein [Paenibacillus phyllosphaerae]MBB3111800.1 hypothetical protein [Paenibacillus phyllosphaerae]